MAVPGTWSEEVVRRRDTMRVSMKKDVGASLEQAGISEHMKEILKINYLIYFNYKTPGNSKLK